jgi:hypothetical protein
MYENTINLVSPPAVPKLARATIFLAFFANGFLSTCWVVHIPRIRGLLGLSDGELGLILWAATLGLFLGMTLGGWIVDRYQSQFVTGIATVCLGVATVLAVISTSRPALALSLVPFGFLFRSLCRAPDHRLHCSVNRPSESSPSGGCYPGHPPRDRRFPSSTPFLEGLRIFGRHEILR